jgi:2,3-bisphosphoglycerate-independent phosphoglycerate mutase
VPPISAPVLLIFLDGVGLGQSDPASNPLVRARMPIVSDLLGGPLILHDGALQTARATLIPTDANLGVDGLPQSATGQTTILTGVNAAQEMGRHWGPHPNEQLRTIIARDSIFKKLSGVGGLGAFANAYPERYFADVARGKRGLSATGLAARAGGLRLRDHDDLRAGDAVSAFFDNRGWRDTLGYADIPEITPRQAGQNLAAIARRHDFTLFEHYYTDICGHHQDWPQAIQTLETLDEFLGGVLDGFSDDMLLIVTSDHGNIEDLSVRGHTANPVPTLLVGKRRASLSHRIANLADLTPAILDLITITSASV